MAKDERETAKTATGNRQVRTAVLLKSSLDCSDPVQVDPRLGTYLRTGNSGRSRTALVVRPDFVDTSNDDYNSQDGLNEPHLCIYGPPLACREFKGATAMKAPLLVAELFDRRDGLLASEVSGKQPVRLNLGVDDLLGGQATGGILSRFLTRARRSPRTK